MPARGSSAQQVQISRRRAAARRQTSRACSVVSGSYASHITLSFITYDLFSPYAIDHFQRHQSHHCFLFFCARDAVMPLLISAAAHLADILLRAGFRPAYHAMRSADCSFVYAVTRELRPENLWLLMPYSASKCWHEGRHQYGYAEIGQAGCKAPCHVHHTLAALPAAAAPSKSARSHATRAQGARPHAHHTPGADTLPRRKDAYQRAHDGACCFSLRVPSPALILQRRALIRHSLCRSLMRGSAAREVMLLIKSAREGARVTRCSSGFRRAAFKCLML